MCNPQMWVYTIAPTYAAEEVFRKGPDVLPDIQQRDPDVEKLPYVAEKLRNRPDAPSAEYEKMLPTTNTAAATSPTATSPAARPTDVSIPVEQVNKQRNNAGMRRTILTSSRGDLTKATTTRKLLLGQ